MLLLLHASSITCALISLCERKKQWNREEEERVAALPDPSVPQGHVAMPKKEKQDTLKLLQDCELYNNTIIFPSITNNVLL